MKRGQFEIMGLAIVMVIISIGVFFLISLSLDAPDDDLASQFLTDQFSQNVLDAFLKSSHPDCPSETVSRYFVWNATQMGPARCTQERTWDKLNQTLDKAIRDYAGREYNFTVRKNVCETPTGCADNITYTSGSCDPRRSSTGRAGRQTLPKYPRDGSVEVVLWLC